MSSCSVASSSLATASCPWGSASAGRYDDVAIEDMGVFLWSLISTAMHAAATIWPARLDATEARDRTIDATDQPQGRGLRCVGDTTYGLRQRPWLLKGRGDSICWRYGSNLCQQHLPSRHMGRARTASAGAGARGHGPPGDGGAPAAHASVRSRARAQVSALARAA